MGIRTDTALELYSKGFSCSQALLAAFCEHYGMTREMGAKIASGLGGGVKSAEVCGAVTGAVLVVGLKYGQSDPADKAARRLCGEKTGEFLQAFTKQNTHIVCRDILGCDITTPEGKAQAIAGQYFTTRCADMVASAAAILEEAGY